MKSARDRLGFAVASWNWTTFKMPKSQLTVKTGIQNLELWWFYYIIILSYLGQVLAHIMSCL